MTTPYYTVTGSVEPGNRIKGFFQDGPESPARLLDNPDRFRFAGFDVSTGDYAKLKDGKFWEVSSGDRKILQLYQDGTVLFRMRADGEFLGWGQQNLGNVPWVNPVAVVESHASFVYLYRRVLSTMMKQPTKVIFSFRFKSAQVGENRLFITKHFEQPIQWVNDPRPFPIHDVEASDELTVVYEDLLDHPDGVTYRLVELFYRAFDAEPALIPFTKQLEGRTEIDMTAFQDR